jgi:hypothetical protein
VRCRAPAGGTGVGVGPHAGIWAVRPPLPPAPHPSSRRTYKAAHPLRPVLSCPSQCRRRDRHRRRRAGKPHLAHPPDGVTPGTEAHVQPHVDPFHRRALRVQPRELVAGPRNRPEGPTVPAAPHPHHTSVSALAAAPFSPPDRHPVHRPRTTPLLAVPRMLVAPVDQPAPKGVTRSVAQVLPSRRHWPARNGAHAGSHPTRGRYDPGSHGAQRLLPGTGARPAGPCGATEQALRDRQAQMTHPERALRRFFWHQKAPHASPAAADTLARIRPPRTRLRRDLAKEQRNRATSAAPEGQDGFQWALTCRYSTV